MVAKGYEVSLGGNENVLKLTCCENVTIARVCNTLKSFNYIL